MCTCSVVSNLCFVHFTGNTYNTVRTEQREEEKHLRSQHCHNPVGTAYDGFKALEHHFGTVLRRQDQECDNHREEHDDYVCGDESFQKWQIFDQVDVDNVCEPLSPTVF
jgi:hypothetical protein